MTDLSAITQVHASGPPRPSESAPVDEAVLRKAARDFETAFLSEMLKHTGLGRMPDGFNGGAGEAAFSGFLVQEYAGEIARTGRIGLADKVYTALAARVTP